MDTLAPYEPIVRDPNFSLTSYPTYAPLPYLDKDVAVAGKALDVLLLDYVKRPDTAASDRPAMLGIMLSEEKSADLRIRYFRSQQGTSFEGYTPHDAALTKKASDIITKLHADLKASGCVEGPVYLQVVASLPPLSNHDVFRLETALDALAETP
jgi:hypothetical protein